MIRILIVDDHTVVREGLRHLLSKTPDMRITGEASNVETALMLLEEQQWDVALLDIALPGGTGLAGIPRFRRLRPGMPILIFSGFSAAEYATACEEAGASGYLIKDRPPDEIRNAIRVVAAGGRFVSSGTALGPEMPVVIVPDDLHASLTPKEFDILCRISRGQGLTEIGDRLCLSVKTISTHRANILEKMGMRTNADLIRYAISHGLDDGDGEPVQLNRRSRSPADRH